MKRISFKQVFGPGIIMAGAAIGVSHLIQATRAGADYGFSLWWILLLACLTKYPFLEFGSRYAAATNETLLDGYKKIGKGAFEIYALITIFTMFIIQAAVTLVTAGLAEQLFGLGFSMWTWCLIILGICITLIFIGNYPALDKAMKITIITLTLLTLVAVIIIFGTPAPAQALSITPQTYLNTAGIAFIIAFMGWMPIPLDASVWQSIWVREKSKQTQYKASVKEVLLDFKIGYFAAAFIGILFFLLGVFVMFGQGKTFPAGSVDFSAMLVDMYGTALGNWSRPIISIAAFVAMFSTTLAVTDIYPRLIMEFASTYNKSKKNKSFTDIKLKRIYQLFLVFIPIISLIFLSYIKSGFTQLIDFAAGLSFLSAPIIAWYNLKLINSKWMPEQTRPKKWYLITTRIFLAFLILFSFFYLYWVIFL